MQCLIAALLRRLSTNLWNHAHHTWVHVHYASTCTVHEYMCTTWIHVHYTNIHALHRYMCTAWVHVHYTCTSQVHVNYTSTCALHEYMCTYTSTCELHKYMCTTWVHVHYTSTCALHEYMCITQYMCTTRIHVHYTSTYTLHEYISTTQVHAQYTACVRQCIIPLVTQMDIGNSRWITRNKVILQSQWSRVIVLISIVHFLFQVKIQKAFHVIQAKNRFTWINRLRSFLIRIVDKVSMYGR